VRGGSCSASTSRLNIERDTLDRIQLTWRQRAFERNYGTNCDGVAGAREREKRDAKAEEEGKGVKSQIFGQCAVKKGEAWLLALNVGPTNARMCA
jgi:hypothetical protein